MVQAVIVSSSIQTGTSCDSEFINTNYVCYSSFINIWSTMYSHSIDEVYYNAIISTMHMEHTLDIDDAPIVCEIMYYLIQTTHYATGCDSEFIYSNVSYSSSINIWSTTFH